MQKIARNKGLLRTEVKFFLVVFIQKGHKINALSRYKIGICCESL